jgi:hypothetical protein
MQKCVADIVDAARRAGFEVDEVEAADILDQVVDDIERRIDRVYSQSQEDQIVARRLQIHRQAKINAAIQKRNFLINQKRVAAIRQQIQEYVDAGLGDEGQALLDIMVGSLKNYRRGRMSVDARRKGALADAGGLLLAELERKDLVRLFETGSLDEEIYIELFDSIGMSGSDEAREIAEIIRKVQKNLLDRKNRNGANIGELINYVVRQRHDPNRLRDAGFEKWRDDIIQLLDTDRTFAGIRDPKEQEAFLKEAYEHLVTGRFQKVSSVFGEDGKVDPLTAFKGPANLAKKLSGSRVLHFKDGQSSFAYANQYSGRPLINAVLDGISNDAESIALMEVFGTNPGAMVNRLIDDLGLEGRAKARVENALKELDGTTRAVGSSQKRMLGNDMTSVAASIRALQNMSKLGFATISSFSDIASKATLLQRETGRSFLQSYNIAITDVMKAFNDQQKQEFSYLLGTGLEAFLGSIHSRFGADDQLPGKVSKLQQIYFKLNGMQFWNAAQKDGTARVLAADLSNAVDRPFSELGEGYVQTLALYDIDGDDLGLFRGLDRTGPDGRKYVFTEMVDDIPDASLDRVVAKRTGRLEVTNEMRQQFRDDLKTRIAAYYTDSADAAVPTPDARERAIMNQGLERGTPAGEAIRMLSQFKSFPITFVTKGLYRQFYGKQAQGKSGALGLVQLITGMTAMGYVSNATKDILKGREPREVFTEDRALKGLAEAMTAGGGLGIYGDFLFGEYSRYGQSFTQTLAGPTFGMIDDIAAIYSTAFINGDFGKAGEMAVNDAFRMVPGQNLFWAKFGIDYLMLYGISEASNPGYTKRLERRMEKEYGSEFFLPPSKFAVGG